MGRLERVFSMSEFPHNEYDPTCGADANCQHMRYMLEGYRAYVLDPYDVSPYSPGGARDVSWKKGFEQAGKDSKPFQAPAGPPNAIDCSIPDTCPTCKSPFENIAHPLKPGVTMMRTCKCRFETQAVEGGTITIVNPPDETGG